MKKVFILFTLLASGLSSAYADDVTATIGSDDVIYATPGETIDMNIYATNSIALGSISYQVTVDKASTGIVINHVSGDETTPAISGAGVCASFTTTGIFTTDMDAKVTSFSTGTFAASSTEQLVGKLSITAPSTLGSYDITVSLIEVSDGTVIYNPVSSKVSTLKVQRAEHVESAGSDYALEAIPTHVASGATTMTIPVDFKNVGYVHDMAFNIEYPTGMLTTKSGKSYPLTVTKTRMDTGSGATLVVKATSGTTVAWTNADDDLVEPGSGSMYEIPVTLTSVADGVYTIKLTNITAEITDDEANYIKTVTIPDYYFSVFVGTPTETDPIVYGHYTTEGQAALKAAVSTDATTGLHNFASVDMSECIVADESAVSADLNGILVYGPTTTKYTRTATNYSTICLPIAPNTGDATYYTISSMNSSNLVVTEATPAANTPYIFKGTATASADGYCYANPETTGLTGTTVNNVTLTGTYKTFALADGAGYYLANNCFYNDHAIIAPFRAYLAGTASVNAFRILLEDETGLTDITDQFSQEDIYNLQGMKLNKSQRGINIINGKKVLVK